MKCHPKRSLTRILRQTKSKNLCFADEYSEWNLDDTTKPP